MLGLSQADNANAVALASQLGVRWLRPAVNWGDVEPTLARPSLTVAQVKANPSLVEEYSRTVRWTVPDALLGSLGSAGIQPFVVVGHGMRVLLAPRGTLNSALAQVGMVDLSDPSSIAFTWIGIVISLAWKNLALAVLLVLGAYRAVDEAFLEMARNMGASTFRQIRDILVPMSTPSLVVASAFMFTSMLASFSIPLMIGGGEPPHMLMVDVFYRINYQDDLGTANALGMVSYLFAMGVAGYYLRAITARPV